MNKPVKPKPRRKRQSIAARPAACSEQALRDAAYYLWEHEGRPEGRALDHWVQASQRLQTSGSTA